MRRAQREREAGKKQRDFRQMSVMKNPDMRARLGR